MVLTSRKFASLIGNQGFRRKFPEFGLQYQLYDRTISDKGACTSCAKRSAGRAYFNQAVRILKTRSDIAARLKTHLGADTLDLIDRSGGGAKLENLA